VGIHRDKPRPAVFPYAQSQHPRQPSGGEGRVVRLDILYRKSTMSLVVASGLAIARGGQRDRVVCARRGNIDQAAALAVGEIRSLLRP
jgi:hypothetical protein